MSMLCTTFEQLDTNNDGQIELEDIVGAFARVDGVPYDKAMAIAQTILQVAAHPSPRHPTPDHHAHPTAQQPVHKSAYAIGLLSLAQVADDGKDDGDAIVSLSFPEFVSLVEGDTLDFDNFLHAITYSISAKNRSSETGRDDIGTRPPAVHHRHATAASPPPRTIALHHRLTARRRASARLSWPRVAAV
jgi:hypothetical protein